MEQYNLIKCQECGIEIEMNKYCQNCFSIIDLNYDNERPSKKIDDEAIYLFGYRHNFGYDSWTDDIYYRQTPSYIEWIKKLDEKTQRNKERVKMYRLQQDILAAKKFLEKHGYIVQKKDEIISIIDMENSYPRCPKCFSDLEWGRIPCNDMNCNIIHNGYFCIKCKIVYNKNLLNE